MDVQPILRRESLRLSTVVLGSLALAPRVRGGVRGFDRVRTCTPPALGDSNARPFTAAEGTTLRSLLA